MKTTAGIMPSLGSIAWANECRQDAKHVWAQPLVVDGAEAQGLGVTGAGLTVAVPGSEVVGYWHRPQDSYWLPQKQCHMGADTRPPSQSGRNHDSTAYEICKNLQTARNSHALPLLCGKMGKLWENKVFSFLTLGVTSALYS